VVLGRKLPADCVVCDKAKDYGDDDDGDVAVFEVQVIELTAVEQDDIERETEVKVEEGEYVLIG
jgi:hypothetical protein